MFELVGNYLQGKACKGYASPLDARLPRKDEVNAKVETVARLDPIVLCDPSKLDKLGCRGAPDWLIEVQSPSTALKDMNTKRSLYEQHRVQDIGLSARRSLDYGVYTGCTRTVRTARCIWHG